MRGATGNRSELMIGIEPGLTQRPDLAEMLSVVHKPPLATELEATDVESGFVDPTGFAPHTDTGRITGDSFDTTLRLSAAPLFEFLYQLHGTVNKSSASDSSWRYVFTPDPDGDSFTLSAYTGLPPVERRWTEGLIINSLSIPLGGDSTREVNIKGAFLHGTFLSTREAIAVSGSYTGPDVRGDLERDDLGDLFVSYDATADTYRLQQGSAYVPDAIDLFEVFSGIDADQPVAVDHLGNGVYANAQGLRRIRGSGLAVGGAGITAIDARFTEDIDLSAGKQPFIVFSDAPDNLVVGRVNAVLDDNMIQSFSVSAVNAVPGLGVIEPMVGPVDLGSVESGTPLQIIFAGSSVDRGAAADGDLWTFRAPGTWASPASLLRAGGVKFSVAHQRVRTRKAGSSDPWRYWINTDGSVEILWPSSLEAGDGSLHRTNWDRDGAALINVNLQQKYRQDQAEWVRLVSSRQKVEMEIIWQAGLLGNDADRQTIVIRMPSVRAAKAPRPIANTEAIQIAPELQGRTNPGGVAPWEIEFVSDIDWTVPVIP